jgi:preprotein translocase subunit SecE
MADKTDIENEEQATTSQDVEGAPASSDLAGADAGEAPAQLGSTKYVHAAFFTAAILGAFLLGRILESVWNRLAEWPAAVRALPSLLRYAEDERAGFTMAMGAVVALVVVIQTYRKEGTRRWADEVASELAKVVWPNKETVTNGTIVVIIASLIATLYVGLLDRFWGFVTTLVYGA